MNDEQFICDIVALYLANPPYPSLPTDNEFKHAMQMYIDCIENPESLESLKSIVKICTLLNNFFIQLNGNTNNVGQFTSEVLSRVMVRKTVPKWDYLIDKALKLSI